MFSAFMRMLLRHIGSSKTKHSPSTAASSSDVPSHGPIPDDQRFGLVPLSGRRKALLVGINYTGQKGQLNGCLNDVQSMLSFITVSGFPSDPEHLLILTDEAGVAPELLPNHSNIHRGMKWLVEGAEEGDSLFFHYSGHGTRVQDITKDEKDGYDEALVPVDFKESGLILDDEIYEVLIKEIPSGCRLTVLLDCCHSGSGCDLPFFYQASCDSRETDFKSRVPEILMNQHWEFKNFQDMVKQGKTAGMEIWNEYKRSLEGKDTGDVATNALRHFEVAHGEEANMGRSPQGDVVMVSGCMDMQTSADVHDVAVFELPDDSGPGRAGGACTSALLAMVKVENEKLSFLELLHGMRKELKDKGFSQIPQLSSTKRIEMDREFSLVK